MVLTPADGGCATPTRCSRVPSVHTTARFVCGVCVCMPARRCAVCCAVSCCAVSSNNNELPIPAARARLSARACADARVLGTTSGPGGDAPSRQTHVMTTRVRTGSTPSHHDVIRGAGRNRRAPHDAAREHEEHALGARDAVRHPVERRVLPLVAPVEMAVCHLRIGWFSPRGSNRRASGSAIGGRASSARPPR